MSRRERKLSRVQADILARVHFGLPPYNPDPQDGRRTVGKRTSFKLMRAEGLTDGQVVTQEGYYLLAEAARRLDDPCRKPKRKVK